MGLAASQARYLALTARKSDLEYQSQTINNRRLQLAYKTAEIAREYSEAMNNKIIARSLMSDTTDGTTTKRWEELTFSNLVKDGAYMLIGTYGQRLNPDPYKTETYIGTTKVSASTLGTDTSGYEPAEYVKTVTETMSDSEYSAYSGADKSDYQATTASDSSTVYIKTTTTTFTADEYAEYTGSDKPANFSVSTYRLKTITSSEYNALTSTEQDAYEPASVTASDEYTGPDLQTLLVSGNAQIVTKAFYNYLVQNGYNKGMTVAKYEECLEKWTSMNENTGIGSVVDWRSDTTNNFKQRYYTEDDADALAKYEAQTAELQAQDKVLECEEKNIETQHKAVETEVDGLKKLIEGNIEKGFKMFS